MATAYSSMAGTFSHEYQGGSHVELLTASGSDPLLRWRLQGTVKREFHNQLKGYVVALIGSSATTRLQLPNSDKKTLGLVQPHLLLQLLAPHEPRILIELSLLDGCGCRRRIHISSSQRELSVTPQCGKLPLHCLPAAQWALLCVDMASLMRGLFAGQEFQSLERISIAGSCCVRKVFTMRNMPSSAIDLPSACQPPPSAPSFLYTPLNYTIASGAREGDGGDSECDRKQEQVTHVAFGQRIPVPSHINKHHTHAHPSSRCKDSHVMSGEEQEDITDTRYSKKQELVTHVAFGQRIPVPPHIAVKHDVHSDPTSRDGQLLSDIRYREAHNKDTYHIAPSPPFLHPHPPSSRLVKHVHQGKKKLSSPEGSPQAGAEDSRLSRDEELAITALQGSRVAIPGSGMYSYRSPPHSAGRHHQPVFDQVHESSTTDLSLARGARPEDDFLLPHSTIPNIQLYQQDYDWRQYKDSEDELEEGREEIDKLVDKGLQLSLKTRLAHGMLTVPQGVDKNELGASGTLGSTGDGELSAQLRAAIENHLHESLDLTEMGGPLSPMSTSRPADTADPDKGEQELELVYDPELNCFYDPTNGKYYELI